MRHTPFFKPLPGFPQLPCSAGTTTPFPHPSTFPDYLLNPQHNTKSWSLSNATPPLNKPVLLSQANTLAQKPQNTLLSPPPPVTHRQPKPDAIPWGQLSDQLLYTPPTLLTYATFFPPSCGPSFLLLSHCESTLITNMDE